MRFQHSNFPATSAVSAVKRARAKRYAHRRVDPVSGEPILPQPSETAREYREALAKTRDEKYAPEWIDVEGVSWFVARVTSGAERRVAFDLARSGFRAYAPLKRDKVFREQQRGRGKREKRIVVSPAFVGYVFVGACGGRGIGKSMHADVIDVIGFDGYPSAIPGAIVAAINERECNGAFDTVAVPAAPVRRGAPVRWAARGASANFEVGEDVKIVDGPFTEFWALVESVYGTTVTVELGMFGRATKVELQACQIEKAVA